MFFMQSLVTQPCLLLLFFLGFSFLFVCLFECLFVQILVGQPCLSLLHPYMFVCVIVKLFVCLFDGTTFPLTAASRGARSKVGSIIGVKNLLQVAQLLLLRSGPQFTYSGLLHSQMIHQYLFNLSILNGVVLSKTDLS